MAKLQPPASFEQARRALFRFADLDEDGQLSYDSRYRFEYGEEMSEWEALFRVFTDVESVYGKPDLLRGERAALAPKRLRKSIRQGVLDFDSVLQLSQHCLLQTVKDINKIEHPTGEQSWRAAEALISLHLWKEATPVLANALKSGAVVLGLIKEVVQNWQTKGRHLEATWFLNFIRSGVKTPGHEEKAEELSAALPRPKTARPLRPAPEAYAKSEYLEALKHLPAAACPDIEATREAVMGAVRGQRPARMRGANLAPDIHFFDHALRQRSEQVAQFDVSHNAVYDFANASDQSIVAARQVAKLGDIEALAQLEGALFNFEIGEDMDDLARFVDTIPIPSIAQDLNLSKRHLWASVGGGTVSNIHYDEYENIISQVRGSKDIVLWPPEDFAHLGYEGKRQYTQLFHCCPVRFEYVLGPPDQKAWNAATVHLSEWQQYPQLQKTSPIYCRLNPGDALVVPVFWHHTVISHPGDADSCELCGALSNVALNFWFTPHRHKFIMKAYMCTAVVELGQCQQEHIMTMCRKTCQALFQQSKAASGRDEI